jgi:hypothetical protein
LFACCILQATKEKDTPITLYKNVMKNLNITTEMKQQATERINRMPIGTFQRIKLNGEVSDIVIQKQSSGVYFILSPEPIGINITDKPQAFVYFSELN